MSIFLGHTRISKHYIGRSVLLSSERNKLLHVYDFVRVYLPENAIFSLSAHVGTIVCHYPWIESVRSWKPPYIATVDGLIVSTISCTSLVNYIRLWVMLEDWVYLWDECFLLVLPSVCQYDLAICDSCDRDELDFRCHFETISII